MRFLRTNNETCLLRQVTIGSWLFLAVMAAGGWWLADQIFAQSVLLGGILVNASFWLLTKDVHRLMQRLSQAEAGLVIQTEKTRFFLRSCARLVVLGLLLFAVASKVSINVIGLSLGFTTVMVSVVIIGVGASKCRMPSKV